MKRKALTLTICFLALVSIVSIGFASWIITKPIQEQTAAGSITAEAVSVKGYTLGVQWQHLGEGVTQPTIHFGKAADYTAGADDWLTNIDGTVEALTCTLRITSSNVDNITSLTLTITALEKELNSDETAFGKALNAGYIAMPTVQVGSNSAAYDVANKVTIAGTDFVKENADDADGYCDVVITFAWGTEFGGQNPIKFYNASAYSDTLAEEAQTALEAIYAIGEATTTYKVVVAPTTVSE